MDLIPENIKADLAQADKFNHSDFIDLISDLAKDKDKRFLYLTRDLYTNLETKKLWSAEVLDKILKLQATDNVILLNYKNAEFAPTPPPLTLLMAFLAEVRGEALVSVNGVSSVADINKESVIVKLLGDKERIASLDHIKFLDIWGKNDFGFLGIMDRKDWHDVRYLFNGLNRSGIFESISVFDYLINNSFLDPTESLDRFFVGQKIMRCSGCNSYLLVDNYDTIKVICSTCHKKATNLKQ